MWKYWKERKVKLNDSVPRLTGPQRWVLSRRHSVFLIHTAGNISEFLYPSSPNSPRTPHAPCVSSLEMPPTS